MLFVILCDQWVEKMNMFWKYGYNFALLDLVLQARYAVCRVKWSIREKSTCSESMNIIIFLDLVLKAS